MGVCAKILGFQEGGGLDADRHTSCGRAEQLAADCSLHRCRAKKLLRRQHLTTGFLMGKPVPRIRPTRWDFSALGPWILREAASVSRHGRNTKQCLEDCSN